MTIYLRMPGGLYPRLKRFDRPLEASHLLVEHMDLCPGCNRPFKAGDLVALVVIGPGDDQEEQMKCRSSRPYNAVAVAVHTACATGELP